MTDPTPLSDTVKFVAQLGEDGLIEDCRDTVIMPPEYYADHPGEFELDYPDPTKYPYLSDM